MVAPPTLAHSKGRLSSVIRVDVQPRLTQLSEKNDEFTVIIPRHPPQTSENNAVEVCDDLGGGDQTHPSQTCFEAELLKRTSCPATAPNITVNTPDGGTEEYVAPEAAMPPSAVADTRIEGFVVTHTNGGVYEVFS
jgi:hypothetical protein